MFELTASRLNSTNSLKVKGLGLGLVQQLEPAIRHIELQLQTTPHVFRRRLQDKTFAGANCPNTILATSSPDSLEAPTTHIPSTAENVARQVAHETLTQFTFILYN